MKSLKILILILLCSVGMFGQESIIYLKGSTTGGQADIISPYTPTNLIAERYTQSVIYAFHDSVDAAISTQIVSLPVVPTGFIGDLDISAVGGDYRTSVLESWKRTRGLITIGDTVWVVDTSSATNGIKSDVLLTISGIVDTFSVTTVAGSSYSTEVQQYFDRLPRLYGGDTLSWFEDCIDGLVSDGVWAELDAVNPFLGDTYTAALVDLKYSTAATRINTPTYTAWDGFTATSDGGVNTNFNPSTDATNYTLNDGSITYIGRTSVASTIGIRCLIGVQTASPDYITSMQMSNSNFYFYLNDDDGTGGAATSSFTPVGIMTVSRDASNSYTSYLNGAYSNDDVAASNGIPNGDISVLCRNLDGSYDQFWYVSTTGYKTGGWAIGGNLTLTQVGYLNTRLETLRDHFGTGVQ